MPYIYFTEEQKQRANSVDLVDFLQRQGEQLTRSGRDWRWKRHDSVTVRGNKWFRHSCKEGGHAIDFVQEFYDMSFPEAVSFLLGGESGMEWNQTDKCTPPPRKTFSLPEENPNMRRVFAYLMKQRFIHCEVLSHFAREKLIYEDRQHHNAVFVGLDEHGIARHAHKRSTYTQGNPYKGNVESSDPRYSFHWIGESDTLYVFEAPIDLLSFITLNLKEWKHHSYVTLDGVSEHAMLCQLELNPHLKKTVLCLDHDPAGIEAAGRLKDILRKSGYYDPACSNVEIRQSIYKDWNEDLKALYGITPIPAKEHPKVMLLPQVCSGVQKSCRFLSVNKEANVFLLEECEKMTLMLRSESFQTEDLKNQLRYTAAGALLVIQEICRQMGVRVSVEEVTGWMQEEYKPYKDRGWLRTKKEDICCDIKDVSGHIHDYSTHTLAERKALLKPCLKLALDCVKAEMVLIMEPPVMQPQRDQSGNLIMTM